MLNRTARLFALGCTSLLGGLIACGSSGSSGGGQAATSATVAIDLYDANGNASGVCAGTVISPDTVLTSGHCVSGKYWWKVTVPSTGQIAHSSIGYTQDWQDFQSSLSHPNHNDVAILKLDTPIHLSQYPTIATSPLADGTGVMRIHPGAESGFEALGAVAYDGANVGFPQYYYTSFPSGEALVTGTALIDPVTNTIFGVVSGRGKMSGNLYVSRAEVLSDWLIGKSMCSAGGSTPVTTSSEGITPDCHPKPPPPCDGGMSSSSSSGSSSGGSTSSSGSGSGSGGGSGSSSGASGSSSGTTGGSTSSGGTTGGDNGGGDNGGGDNGGGSTSSSGGATGGGNGGMGDGGSCSNGGGTCCGSGCGNGGGGGGGGGTGGGSGSSSGGTSSGGNPPTTGGGGGAGGTGGGSGSGSGSGSGGGVSSGGNPPTTGGGGCTGSDCGGGDTGDGPGCNGPSCGGCTGNSGCSDGTEDFGNCGCTNTPTQHTPIY